jgi:hypothetical protein
MSKKLSLLLVVVLLAAIPVTAAELWVAPAIDPPDTEVGDWAVTAGGRTHFSFALPDDMNALTSVKVVLIGKNDKKSSADVYLSIAMNEERYDEYTDSTLLWFSSYADEILEVDVTSIFPAKLVAGIDYVSLYFSTKFARVVGLRFTYESVVSVVADDLAAEIRARQGGDDALESALDYEATVREERDDGLFEMLNEGIWTLEYEIDDRVGDEKSARELADYNLQTQIDAISPVRSGTLGRTGEAFIPSNQFGGMEWTTVAGFGYLSCSGACDFQSSANYVRLSVGIDLPDGVAVTEFTCYWWDNYPLHSAHLNFSLLERPWSSEGLSSLGNVDVHTDDLDWSPSIQNASDSSSNYAIIDNSSNTYFISGSWSQDGPASLNLRFYGCRVDYDIPE